MNKHMVGIKTKYNLKETQAKNNTEMWSDEIQTTHPQNLYSQTEHADGKAPGWTIAMNVALPFKITKIHTG